VNRRGARSGTGMKWPNMGSSVRDASETLVPCKAERLVGGFAEVRDAAVCREYVEFVHEPPVPDSRCTGLEQASQELGVPGLTLPGTVELTGQRFARLRSGQVPGSLDRWRARSPLPLRDLDIETGRRRALARWARAGGLLLRAPLGPARSAPSWHGRTVVKADSTVASIASLCSTLRTRAPKPGEPGHGRRVRSGGRQGPPKSHGPHSARSPPPPCPRPAVGGVSRHWWSSVWAMTWPRCSRRTPT